MKGTFVGTGQREHKGPKSEPIHEKIYKKNGVVSLFLQVNSPKTHTHTWIFLFCFVLFGVSSGVNTPYKRTTRLHKNEKRDPENLVEPSGGWDKNTKYRLGTYFYPTPST